MGNHTGRPTSVEFGEKEQDLTSADTKIHISLSTVESSQDIPQRTSIAFDDHQNIGNQEVQHFTGEEAFPRDIHGWKWGLVTTAILSSIYLYSVDVTVVADVQPIIILEFGQIEKLPWLSVGFLVTATATNLIWGKIYGQFNAKWIYLLCVLIFEVGSAVCGAAPSMDAMIIGRAICGIGGSGLYVGVMTLIAMTTTMPERPLYVSGTGLTWGIGIVTGPIIGGAFSNSSAGWRWAFYINLVIGAVAAPIWLFLLPNKDPRQGVALKYRAKEMDYIGAIISAGAFVSGVMAISFGGVTYPWNSGRIIGLFVASGALFVILGVQQVYTVFTNKVRRIIPVEFFSSRTVLILFAVTSAGGTAVFVPIYMIPLFFQFTRGDSALRAGVHLLPYIAFVVTAIFINGATLSKFGYYQPWFIAGGLLAVVGGSLMYIVNVDTNAANVYGYSIILGTGAGLWLQASFSVAQAVVEPALIPSAVGFITCAQFVGITIALAIANSIYLNKSQASISEILPNVPLEDIQAAMSGSRSTFLKTLSESQRGQVLEAIVSSMSETYILVITAGALVAVLSLVMKRERVFVVAGGVGGA